MFELLTLLVTSVSVTVLMWVFFGTRTAFAVVVGATSTILIWTSTIPLPSDPLPAGLLIIGTIVAVAVLYAAIYVVPAIGLAIVYRICSKLISLLLAPHDTDKNPLPSHKRRVVVGLDTIRKTAHRVQIDYFRPNSSIVDTDPWYYQWVQRRAYFHADPETVNYELRWLNDHLRHDDEDARQHVKTLQRELDSDRIWSP